MKIIIRIFCLLLFLLLSVNLSMANVLSFKVHPANGKGWVDTGLNESVMESFTRQNNSEYSNGIIIKFNKQGSKKLEEVSTANIDKEMAILFFDNIINTPKIMEPLSSGEVWISGDTNTLDKIETALINVGIKKKATTQDLLIPIVVGASLIILLSLVIWGVLTLFKKFGAKVIIKRVFVYGLLPCLGIGIICSIGFGVRKGIENVTLPKCDSKFAEQQVLEIFKQHNEKYNKYVKYGFIGDIKFSNPAPESYDKDIKRYECTADVTMYPNSSLGLPSSILRYGDGITRANFFYQLANCRVSYSIYKANGKNEVRTTTCSDRYDRLEFINYLNNPAQILQE